ncbi:MAG: sugar transferase [Clostridia bacterium]|nr:sugar transferase [Clostridia bacterium]
MYRRSASGWMKHIDFILIDTIALQLAYSLAYFCRMNSLWPYHTLFYRNLGLFLLLENLFVTIVFNTMHNVLRRGMYVEFLETIKQALIVFSVATIALFSTQTSDAFSRIVVFLTLLFHIILGFGTRVLYKTFLKRHKTARGAPVTMLAVLRADTAEEMIGRITENVLEDRQLVGIVLDRDSGKSRISGIPVVCTLEETSQYICREWIDSVFIDCPSSDARIQKIMDDCRQMAVPVHYHVTGMTKNGLKQFIEKIGDSTVITSTFNYATPVQRFIKRFVDIIGGLVGTVICFIVIAIVGPIIKIASPGPILYKQERIGENGRRFKMLKIRSMHMDADKRKADLEAQNRIKGGMMFKLDFDPRIIGNEVLPDGSHKTGIGEFIRKTSLDETPQFINVIKGDMSLVGTRPPTVDEWEKYEFHHRARLACKPGLTGMWQISGRSGITDFEEVVRLDTEYIEKWSLALDFKILIKTVIKVFSGDGAM